MHKGNVPKLDHGAGAVSTPEPDASERDNTVRYQPGQRGHVESHFLKANSPDGRRAIWLKHTVLAPLDKARDAIAEVWAIAFDEHGTRKFAAKQTYPIASARFASDPFSIHTPDAELTTGRAAGTVCAGSTAISWSLALERPAGALTSFRPFPLTSMYTGPFPRSKSLTPGPDLRVHGHVQIGDARWALENWRGAQGHNWGRSHAHAYAWVHANAWCDEGRSRVREGVWLEALSGRVKVGRLITPFLSVAGLAIDGELVRFDGPRALFSRKIKVSTRSFAFELARPGITLRAEFHAAAPQFAGLRYDDPDGSVLSCLNAKIAEGSLHLRRGTDSVHLRTTQAALELGTRDPAHGIPILV